MKKQSTKAISKKAVAFTLSFFLFCGISQNLYALPDDVPNKAAEISYKGLQDNRLVFNVNYNNESGEPYQLLVKNDENFILYAKQFKGKALNTRMLFTEVPQKCKLVFVIKTGKKEVSQSFEIDTQVKTVEEFIVKGI
jgi:hypothetical protein